MEVGNMEIRNGSFDSHTRKNRRPLLLSGMMLVLFSIGLAGLPGCGKESSGSGTSGAGKPSFTLKGAGQ